MKYIYTSTETGYTLSQSTLCIFLNSVLLDRLGYSTRLLDHKFH